jgi:uncharacterized membrane protein
MNRQALRQLIGMVLLAPIGVQAAYVYTQIDPPGAVTTQVFGINDRGSVVGTDVTTVTGGPFVYRWRSATFHDVAPLSDNTNTSVLGINDAGVMVGGVSGPHAFASRAFIRTRSGHYVVFSHPEAVRTTEARAINNGGLVTGYRDAAGGSTVGFIYDPATGEFTDIVPSAFTIAQGINSAGDVVGSSILNANEACPGAPAGSYGWRRRVDGSVTFFRVNGRDTDARGINDSDFIAGDIVDPVTGNFRGFILKLGAGPCESLTIPDAALLEFPGYDVTIPEGINNAGVLVGIVYNNDDVIFHGFVATRQ